MHAEKLAIATRGRGFHDVTDAVADVVRNAAIETGLAHVFILHTSASLLVTENADPAVRRDLERFMAELAPDGDPRFEHTAEGPDDMSAHVRATLTATSMTLPIRRGRLALGTWQALYLWEHRHASHRRVIEVTVSS